MFGQIIKFTPKSVLFYLFLLIMPSFCVPLPLQKIAASQQAQELKT